MDLLDPAIEPRFLSCRQILYQLNYQGSPYDTVEVIIQHNAGDAAEKDTPHPKAKEKPQHDGKRGKNTFRIKPHTCQRPSEGSNIPGPRDPTETETELCLSISCGGTSQQWTAAGTEALGAEDLLVA